MAVFQIIRWQSRHLLAAAALLLVALATSAFFGQNAESQEANGDVLPSGALVRIGTVQQGSKPATDEQTLSSIRQTVFSADGRLLATRGEPADPSARRLVHVWDVDTGKLLHTISTQDESLTALAFSGDAKQVISATQDHPQGTQIREVASGELVRSFPGGRGQFFLAADGRTIKIVDRFQKNDVIRTFDLTSGHEVGRSVVDVSYRFEFGPDGLKQLAQRSQRTPLLRLIDVANGKLISRLDRDRGEPGAMAFSANGRTVAVAVSERRGRDRGQHLIVIWELVGANPVFELSGHAGRVLALQFSPDGRFLVSGSADRTVRVWEVATGKEVHTFRGHAGPVAAVDVSPDNKRIVSGSFDRTALMWDAGVIQRTFLAEKPLDAESFERLWDELSAVTPANAYRAIGQLRWHEQAAVEMLHQRIESIVRPVQAERIGQLIVDLEDEDYIVRFRATEQLQKLREIAKPMLLKVAKSTTSAEVKFRIRRILTGGEQTPRFSTADIRRIARVVHVLEYLPGEKTEATLQAIVDDFPADEVVADARATLARLRAKE